MHAASRGRIEELWGFRLRAAVEQRHRRQQRDRSGRSALASKSAESELTASQDRVQRMARLVCAMAHFGERVERAHEQRPQLRASGACVFIKEVFQCCTHRTLCCRSLSLQLFGFIDDAVVGWLVGVCGSALTMSRTRQPLEK